MKGLTARQFDARREKCGQAAQDVLDFLMTVAEHAGADVEKPTFEVGGVGITYWKRRQRFCRFDPKRRIGHVWVLIPGADRASLAAAGKVSARKDGPWIAIKNMREAVRLVPEIVKACDEAGASGRSGVRKQ